MEKDLGISLITRGETIYVSGNDETFEIADRLLGSLLTLIRKGSRFRNVMCCMP